MAKKQVKVRRTGAYVVKAAESRSARVASKPSGRTHEPSGRDKQLAEALLNQRRA